MVKWEMSSGRFLSGLFSSIMRELANLTHEGPKWIVLDGDIDPMWIESLNTVMDDNKVPKAEGGWETCTAYCLSRRQFPPPARVADT